MIEIDECFTKRNLKSKMLLQIHDELVFNIKKDELEIVKSLIKYYKLMVKDVIICQNYQK